MPPKLRQAAPMHHPELALDHSGPLQPSSSALDIAAACTSVALDHSGPIQHSQQCARQRGRLYQHGTCCGDRRRPGAWRACWPRSRPARPTTRRCWRAARTRPARRSTSTRAASSSSGCAAGTRSGAPHPSMRSSSRQSSSGGASWCCPGSAGSPWFFFYYILHDVSYKCKVTAQVHNTCSHACPPSFASSIRGWRRGLRRARAQARGAAAAPGARRGQARQPRRAAPRRRRRPGRPRRRAWGAERQLCRQVRAPVNSPCVAAVLVTEMRWLAGPLCGQCWWRHCQMRPAPASAIWHTVCMYKCMASAINLSAKRESCLTACELDAGCKLLFGMGVQAAQRCCTATVCDVAGPLYDLSLFPCLV